jgi:hypothetical protein
MACPDIIITGGADIRDGRFARPVEDTPVGLGVTVSYRIAGRIGAVRASGSFQGTITGLKDEQPTWTCSIAKRRWSAISG